MHTPGTRYLICLEGNGECAAYTDLAIAEEMAKRFSMKTGVHFIAVPQRENHAHAALLAACEAMIRLGAFGLAEQITAAIAQAKGE